MYMKNKMRFLSLLEVWVFLLILGHCRGQGDEIVIITTCGGPILCPVGSLCGVRPPTTESSEGSLAILPSPVLQLTCTHNGHCDEESQMCVCDEGFSSTSYGFCQPTVNSSCLAYACNEDEFLICSEETGRCECPLEGTHFSPTLGKCVAGDGTSCSELLSCTDNAFCNFMFDWQCHCNGGFSSKSPNGECRPSYGSFCSASAPYLECNTDEFLRCVDRKCVCDEGRVWQEGRCVALVGRTCDLKVTVEMTKASFCLSPATCEPKDDDVVDVRQGTCQCPRGTLLQKDTETCKNTAHTSISLNPLIFIFLALLILLRS